MTTFLQNSEQDLVLVGGRLVLCNDARAIAQKTENDFRFFLGEWFLDVAKGMPYFTKIFQKNPDLNVVRSLFKKMILKNPSIAALIDFTLTYDKKSRKISYSWEARTVNGQTISGSNDLILATT